LGATDAKCLAMKRMELFNKELFLYKDQVYVIDQYRLSKGFMSKYGIFLYAFIHLPDFE
jgi:hypothetical protein